MKNKNQTNVTSIPSAKEKFNNVCEICGGIGTIAGAVGSIVAIGINVISNMEESKIKKAKAQAETTYTDAKMALLAWIINEISDDEYDNNEHEILHVMDCVIKKVRESKNIKEVTNAIKYFNDIYEKYTIAETT